VKINTLEFWEFAHYHKPVCIEYQHMKNTVSFFTWENRKVEMQRKYSVLRYVTNGAR